MITGATLRMFFDKLHGQINFDGFASSQVSKFFAEVRDFIWVILGDDFPISLANGLECDSSGWQSKNLAGLSQRGYACWFGLDGRCLPIFGTRWFLLMRRFLCWIWTVLWFRFGTISGNNKPDSCEDDADNG